MEPIINPWVIYILPLVNVFIHVMTAVALLLIIYTDNAFRADRGTKVTKVIGSVFIISTLLAILTPSKNTLIAMYIANHATPENIQMLINTFIK